MDESSKTKVKSKSEKNRREHPRLSAKAEIKVKISDGIQGKKYKFKIGKTQNLSLSGVYCCVNRFIAPFTIVDGVLALPSAKDDMLVHFEGVVVRIEPEKELKSMTDYNIAILFNNMAGKEKTEIGKYIELHDVKKDGIL